jgi:DNA-binding response OmpR family regulator
MTQLKILVAEDEQIIAFDLCDTVEEAGFEVQGPHPDLSSAMLSFQKDRPDLAILDVQLDDGVVFPLAQKLAEENVPIIFHSGQFSAEQVAEQFPGMRSLEKPCPPAQMLQAVNEALQAH